jgi:hypothetical protein
VGLGELLLCSPGASSCALCMVPFSFIVYSICRLCVVLIQQFLLPLFVSGHRVCIGFLCCLFYVSGLPVKDGVLSTVWVSVSPVCNIAMLGYGGVSECLVTV